MSRAESNLPALLDGQVPVQERRARVARPVAKGAAWLSAVLMVLAVVLTEPALAGAALGLLGTLLLTGILSLSNGWQLFRLYPNLGHRVHSWQAAGASRQQLRVLDEAHRVNRRLPPLGYADRRTLITPLADAYAIFTSPAWRDPWLADRKLAIDPVSEAAEIVVYLEKVVSTLREVQARIRGTSPNSAAYRTYVGYERALKTSFDEGLRRARALTAYRHQVAQLEALLTEQRALPEAEAFADRVLDVVSESARHELATRDLEDSRAQLEMLEGGLREITEVLNAPLLSADPLAER